MANGIPRPVTTTFHKQTLLDKLLAVDQDVAARARVLAMEVDFRQRITQHVLTLPAANAQFSKFNTNPFVLLIYSLQKAYRHISQIESAILPAKVFSSMETSAGRMVETVVLPIYGWEVVPSAMHSPNSVLDGKRLDGNVLRLATLKSGPRCLNDEMSENIADAILTNHQTWAQAAGVSEIDFTYGVLYGTELDPIPWTPSERWIRWHTWDQARPDDGYAGSFLRSSGSARSDWSWTRGRLSGRPHVTSI